MALNLLDNAARQRVMAAHHKSPTLELTTNRNTPPSITAPLALILELSGRIKDVYEGQYGAQLGLRTLKWEDIFFAEPVWATRVRPWNKSTWRCLGVFMYWMNTGRIDWFDHGINLGPLWFFGRDMKSPVFQNSVMASYFSLNLSINYYDLNFILAVSEDHEDYADDELPVDHKLEFKREKGIGYLEGNDYKLLNYLMHWAVFKRSEHRCWLDAMVGGGTLATIMAIATEKAAQKGKNEKAPSDEANLYKYLISANRVTPFDFEEKKKKAERVEARKQEEARKQKEADKQRVRRETAAQAAQAEREYQERRQAQKNHQGKSEAQKMWERKQRFGC